MAPLLTEVTAAAGALSRAAPEPAPAPVAARQLGAPSGAMSLHLSKLRGITDRVRARLKRHGITYTDQLLAAAGRRRRRLQLAGRSGIEAKLLGQLACRADLTRIKGVGAIFADMLEQLGVDRIVGLARQDAEHLHRALSEFNAELRFARRAPTLDEVRHWITQARSLPQLVDDDA